MSADDLLDEPSLSLFSALTARYPRWTIWFGHATRHWWALPPRGHGPGDVVEAATVKELVETIEKIQERRWDTSHVTARGFSAADRRHPFDWGRGHETARTRRVPAAAWPGSTVR